MHLWYALSDTTSTGIPGLLTALGINWRSLILNALAFLITMAVLAKYVYPILVRALDNKQDELEAATRLEQRAKKELEAAQAEIEKMITKAHHSADDIISTAKTEADELTQASNRKAAAQAKRIVDEAHEQLGHDIRQARESLKADTARLVASATEILLDEKLNGASDAHLISRSLERVGGKER
jgi:F-type H+-transporting ATPase subunit b